MTIWTLTLTLKTMLSYYTQTCTVFIRLTALGAY